MTTVAFLGLGQMDSPVASNLLQKGHVLRIFGVNQQAANELVQKGTTAAQTPIKAAKGAELIITMLPNDDIVRQVLLGKNGASEGLSPNALVVDISTIRPLQTDELIHEMKEKGISTTDTPMGRTSVNTIDGALLALTDETPEQAKRAHPVLMYIENEPVEASGPGMGIRARLINNCMSIMLSALSAGTVVLYKSLGLSPDVVIKAMSGTAAGKGRLMTTWPGKVFKGGLSPALMVDLALKGLCITIDVASQTGAPLNMGIATGTYYTRASENGRGRQDWDALLSQVYQQAG